MRTDDEVSMRVHADRFRSVQVGGHHPTEPAAAVVLYHAVVTLVRHEQVVGAIDTDTPRFREPVIGRAVAAYRLLEVAVQFVDGDEVRVRVSDVAAPPGVEGAVDGPTERQRRVTLQFSYDGSGKHVVHGDSTPRLVYYVHPLSSAGRGGRGHAGVIEVACTGCDCCDFDYNTSCYTSD